MPDMGTTVGLINSLTAGVKEDVAGKLEAPSTAGTSGQVLVSDGNGGQVWGDIDAGEVVIDSTLSVAGAAADAAFAIWRADGSARSRTRWSTRSPFCRAPFATVPRPPARRRSPWR